MRIQPATRALINAIARSRPVVLVSGPGVGKSSLVASVAKKLEHELHISFPTFWDITDPKGLPMPHPNGEFAVFLPFGEVKKMLEATVPTVWFFDDAGQATEDVQACLMPLFLDRMIGGRKLPDCVKLVLATNGVEHNAGVKPMLAPLKTRMAAFIELEPHIDDWSTWAMTDGNIDPLLVAFLRYKPGYLYQFDESPEMRGFMCPRVWNDVNGWLENRSMPGAELDDNELFEVISSLVREDVAEELKQFESHRKALTNVTKILTTPETAAVPTNPGELYTVATAVSYHVNDATFPNVVKYVQKMAKAKRGDMGTLMVHLCTSKIPALRQSNAYVQFVTSELGKQLLPNG